MATRIPGQKLRPATAADARALLTIYSRYVSDSAVSFEEQVPTIDEFAQRIEDGQQRFPWIVLEAETSGRREVAGYAYAGPHRNRGAYRWSCEVSVYTSEAWRRGGVGSTLYRSLFDALRDQGFFNAYAGITLPNEASVALHTSLGFVQIGVYDRVGFKHGCWHSVGWYQLRLQEGDSPSGYPSRR